MTDSLGQYMDRIAEFEVPDLGTVKFARLQMQDYAEAENRIRNRQLTHFAEWTRKVPAQPWELIAETYAKLEGRPIMDAEIFSGQPQELFIIHLSARRADPKTPLTIKALDALPRDVQQQLALHVLTISGIRRAEKKEGDADNPFGTYSELKPTRPSGDGRLLSRVSCESTESVSMDSPD